MRFLRLIATGLLLFAAVATAQTRQASLASAETTLGLQATSAAPYLASVAVKSGAIWESRSPETLIDHVEISGSVRPLEWQLRLNDSLSDRTLTRFVYESRNPHLRLLWEWRVRAAHGPIEHSIRIENLSGTEVWLPLQDSLQFDFRIGPEQSLKHFWVEKGASSPSAEGTHNVALQVGDEWTGTSSTYAHTAANAKGGSCLSCEDHQHAESREIIPYLLVERADREQSGWYAGIEFSGARD